MRLDQYMQKVGIVKRRSVAKTLCDNGAVHVNEQRAKPAHTVSEGDEVKVKFRQRLASYKVLRVPHGSVKKENRSDYVELVHEELFHQNLDI
jgi:ribosomal 50S subunit-recycling heat shock protein